MSTDNWNPLYPSDEDVDSLEEAAREAEWEDSTNELKKKRRKALADDDNIENSY